MKALSFLIAAGLSFIAFFSYKYFLPRAPTASSASTLIQESMTKVQSKRFDESGRLVHLFQVQSWQREKNNPLSTMAFPTLTLFQENGEWTVSAHSGKSKQTQLQGKLETLQLQNEVLIKQKNKKDNIAWELKTQTLEYFPEKSLALTEDLVTIYGPHVEIHAKGLRAYPKTQLIELLENVKTHYGKPNA